MAVYGVLGDIHGNKEGLVSALDELRRLGVHKFLCVGDVIGYNADPNDCVALVQGLDARTIAGNHDLIGTRQLDFSRCSNKARFSLERTRRTLSAGSRSWIQALPRTLLLDPGIALIHGGVRDVQLYMTTTNHIRRNVPLLREEHPSARLCFFGHSHEPAIYEVSENLVSQRPTGPTRLSGDKLYFVNPGSIDAQRKHDCAMAQFAVLDADRWTLEFHSVPYDAASTEAKAVAGGYRIGPLTDRWYTWRRRIQRLFQRRLGLPSRGTSDGRS